MCAWGDSGNRIVSYMSATERTAADVRHHTAANCFIYPARSAAAPTGHCVHHTQQPKIEWGCSYIASADDMSLRLDRLCGRNLEKEVAARGGHVRDVPGLRERAGLERGRGTASAAANCFLLAHKTPNSNSPISRAVSILRNWTKASPALARAAEMVEAASASPSARMTAAWRSCSAFSTTNLARSASCWAICFCSTAVVNSLPKLQC